jgi:NhaP-type Na+/H+ or K+/H+ antiporter
VREELSEVQEAIARFFLLPVLVLFGAMLPWSEWQALGGAGLMFAAWALFIRRPPAAMLGLLGSDASRRDRAFLSWFGPLGVAAIFYATYIERFDLADHEKQGIFAAATLAIALSIVAHSVTATPGSRMFARRSPFGTFRHPFRPADEEHDDG